MVVRMKVTLPRRLNKMNGRSAEGRSPRGGGHTFARRHVESCCAADGDGGIRCPLVCIQGRGVASYAWPERDCSNTRRVRIGTWRHRAPGWRPLPAVVLCAADRRRPKREDRGGESCEDRKSVV